MGIISFPSSGLIVASALVDVSQQKPSDFKDKSQSLKSRKALPPAHQGTCVWATAPPSTASFSLPSERHVKLEAFQRHGQNTIWLLRLKSLPILAHWPKVGWGGYASAINALPGAGHLPAAQPRVIVLPWGRPVHQTCQYVCTLTPEGKGNVSLHRGLDHHLTPLALLPLRMLFCIMLANKWYSMVLNLPFF